MIDEANSTCHFLKSTSIVLLTIAVPRPDVYSFSSDLSVPCGHLLSDGLRFHTIYALRSPGRVQEDKLTCPSIVITREQHVQNEMTLQPFPEYSNCALTRVVYINHD